MMAKPGRPKSNIKYPGTGSNRRPYVISHVDPRLVMRSKLYAVAKNITRWEAWNRLVIIGLVNEGYIEKGELEES